MWKFDLAERLRHNIALRVIALLVALGLWVFVNAGQRESQLSLPVSVSFRALPAGYLIVNSSPDFINLQVSGPSTLLSLLDPGRLGLRLDLSGVTQGQTEFKIGPQMFNVPRQVSIDRISPASITINVDRLVSREVPVHVTVSGSPATYFAVASSDANPAAVTVTGPSQTVARLDRIETQPLDLNSASSDVERAVALIGPSNLVRLSSTRVQVRARIHEVLADREFRGVELKVRDAAYKFRLQPRHINIAVRGPASKMSALKLDDSVFVDANGATPGSHELPVQIDLPAGIELVRESPKKVKLRVYAQKPGKPS